MKVTAKWELTTVINRELKKKKRKFDRNTYLRLLRESQKYTILQRVASELYRAGVTPQLFLRELHKDDWSLSSRVMEELDRIDRGRNGYDPDKVPPLLPVYLKPIASDSEAGIAFKGRPKRKDAQQVAIKWAKSLLLRGWTEGDIRRSIEDVLDDEEDTKVIVVKSDDDIPDEPKVRTHTKLKYYVHDGLDWQVFASPIKAKEALANLKDLVMGEIRRAEPMADINARICSHCKKPLNGHVMTIREPKTKGKKTRTVVEHLHMNCFWLHRIEACRIPVGMELLNPADGKPYVYQGPEKGGWRLKHELKPVNSVTEPAKDNVVPGGSETRVPQQSSEQPPKVVPTPTAARPEVFEVR